MHRNEIGGHLYRWLKKNNYPDGFQVLCMNCQLIKNYNRGLIQFPNSRNRDWNRKLKLLLIANYSDNTNKCKMCGYSDILALTIDHIDGKGNLQRRNLGNLFGTRFYLWLKNNNFPNGYQVLCMNCNFKKAKKETAWDKI